MPAKRFRPDPSLQCGDRVLQGRTVCWVARNVRLPTHYPRRPRPGPRSGKPARYAANRLSPPRDSPGWCRLCCFHPLSRITARGASANARFACIARHAAERRRRTHRPHRPAPQAFAGRGLGAGAARAARLSELRVAAARIAAVGEYYKLRHRSSRASYGGVTCGLLATQQESQVGEVRGRVGQQVPGDDEDRVADGRGGPHWARWFTCRVNASLSRSHRVGTWPPSGRPRSRPTARHIRSQAGASWARPAITGDPRHADRVDPLLQHLVVEGRVGRRARRRAAHRVLALAALLRRNPDIPVRTLPGSWRLPESAAPVICEAFYRFTGFTAATGPSSAGWRSAPGRSEKCR